MVMARWAEAITGLQFLLFELLLAAQNCELFLLVIVIVIVSVIVIVIVIVCTLRSLSLSAVVRVTSFKSISWESKFSQRVNRPAYKSQTPFHQWWERWFAKPYSAKQEMFRNVWFFPENKLGCRRKFGVPQIVCGSEITSLTNPHLSSSERSHKFKLTLLWAHEQFYKSKLDSGHSLFSPTC